MVNAFVISPKSENIVAAAEALQSGTVSSKIPPETTNLESRLAILNYALKSKSMS